MMKCSFPSVIISFNITLNAKSNVMMMITMICFWFAPLLYALDASSMFNNVLMSKAWFYLSQITRFYWCKSKLSWKRFCDCCDLRQFILINEHASLENRKKQRLWWKNCNEITLASRYMLCGFTFTTLWIIHNELADVFIILLAYLSISRESWCSDT